MPGGDSRAQRRRTASGNGHRARLKLPRPATAAPYRAVIGCRTHTNVRPGEQLADSRCRRSRCRVDGGRRAGSRASIHARNVSGTLGGAVDVTCVPRGVTDASGAVPDPEARRGLGHSIPATHPDPSPGAALWRWAALPAQRIVPGACRSAGAGAESSIPCPDPTPARRPADAMPRRRHRKAPAPGPCTTTRRSGRN
jgi:hypothetical protein